MAQQIILQLISAGFKRTHTLVAVGGGITQDLVCFISSILYRGVKWKFYPTTLLAQADSCIGSKSSINLKNNKNQVGTFYPPTEIIIDVGFLKTLERQEILSGVGEIIKVHFLDPAGRHQLLFDLYNDCMDDPQKLKELIHSSLLIKKDIIEQDEYDRDTRNIMNYGHTFGHALESATHYAVPHGIAVTMGLLIANKLSLKLGLLSAQEEEQMRAIILTHIKDQSFDITAQSEAYFEALKRDKKNVDSDIMCILTSGLGQMFKYKLQLDQDIKQEILHNLLLCGGE